MYLDQYLAHYGVRGQRWGIRRYQPYSIRGRTSGKGGKEIGEAKRKGPSHEDLIKSTNAREVYKYRNRLSDKELRDRVNRIQTEQQLKQLSDASVKKGESFTKKVFNATKNQAANTIALALVTAGAAYITKKTGIKFR